METHVGDRSYTSNSTIIRHDLLLMAALEAASLNRNLVRAARSEPQTNPVHSPGVPDGQCPGKQQQQQLREHSINEKP